MTPISYRITEQDEGTATLSLDGSLTIMEIGELKQVLAEALEQNGHVVVDFSSAGKMDFAWLQLLCSAHRSALATGKDLQLASTYPESFHVLKREAGFDRHCSCPLSTEPGNCLWMGRCYEK